MMFRSTFARKTISIITIQPQGDECLVIMAECLEIREAFVMVNQKNLIG